MFVSRSHAESLDDLSATAASVRGRNDSPWRARVRLVIAATILLFVLTAGWFVFQHLRAKAMDADAPVVCREAIWDFGELSQEKPEELHHRFKLENLTAERIGIKKVVPDCGCVVADNPPSEIEPAATVELPVNVNAAGPLALFRNSFTLFWRQRHSQR